MMTKCLRITTLAVFVQLIFAVSIVQAHYLWVTIDAKTGDHGTTHVYFEGGPAPGDGQYLDPFVKEGKTWIRTLGSEKPTQLKMSVTEKPGKRWLSAPLPASGPRSVDSYGKWGVYRYGKTDVLLHYYARNLDVKANDDLNELGRAEQMAFDVVPQIESGVCNLKVLWQGKPATGKAVTIRGPKGFNENLKSDESGKVQFKLGEKGQYRIQAKVEEDKPGTDNGKEYQLIRHQIRVLINLPLSGE